MKLYDVWQVDTARLVMRSYVEDEYGRLCCEQGRWEAIPSTLTDLRERLQLRGGYQLCYPQKSIIEKWSRDYRGA